MPGWTPPRSEGTRRPSSRTQGETDRIAGAVICVAAHGTVSVPGKIRETGRCSDGLDQRLRSLGLVRLDAMSVVEQGSQPRVRLTIDSSAMCGDESSRYITRTHRSVPS